ncbi:MAG: sugar transferase [Propionibacteriaceae bacterium]|nr:sugar transferase [Propionibacteriaceae bacterium]
MSEDVGGHTATPAKAGFSIARTLFYASCCGLIGALLVTIASPKWVQNLVGGDFPGMSNPSRPWRDALYYPPLLIWMGCAALGLLLAVVLLTLLRHKKRQPITSPGAFESYEWRKVYGLRLIICDVLCVLWAIVGAQLIWFADDDIHVRILGIPVSYNVTSLLIAAGWLIALWVADSRSPLLFGDGITEYARVVSASFTWFGLVAIAAVVTKIDFSRGYVLLAFPLGLVALLCGRKALRSWLLTKRASEALYMTQALVLGHPDRVLRVISEIDRDRAAGYAVRAVAVPDEDALPDELRALGVPIVSYDHALEQMRCSSADTLIITGGSGLTPEHIQELSWHLRPGVEHLVLSPDLVDVAGPRVATRPVAGLSLIHVETPKFSSSTLLVKRSFDVAATGLGLVLLALPLAVVALAVKMSSPGPVFYRQTRIGLGGKEFQIWKFRSMVTNADALLAQLQVERDAGNQVLFKIKDDPRVTGVGKFIRRFSIDELPQLFNVLGGSMSLVGPRPPVPSEVAEYPPELLGRRFLVKPGITGLWQVSGRSDLSWEESMRLDLYYVQNWSFMQDVQLLWRTAQVVLQGDGAY